MEHVVFFPAADGTPAFRRLSSLEEAVRLVEHLRNVEGVDSVGVHALTEVPLQFRAYYRVEVPSALDVPAPVAAEGQPVPAVAEVPAQATGPVLEPVPVPLVDVAPLEPAAVEPEPEPEPVPSLALVEDLPVGEPDPELVASNGHSRDGVASLGFFA